MALPAELFPEEQQPHPIIAERLLARERVNRAQKMAALAGLELMASIRASMVIDEEIHALGVDRSLLESPPVVDHPTASHIVLAGQQRDIGNNITPIFPR